MFTVGIVEGALLGTAVGALVVGTEDGADVVGIRVGRSVDGAYVGKSFPFWHTERSATSHRGDPSAWYWVKHSSWSLLRNSHGSC